VLELARTDAAVLCCLAQPHHLDSLANLDGAFSCRVAADELLLLAPAAVHRELLDPLAALLNGRDPHSVVVDQSPGWSVWTLAGSDVGLAFARLSAIPLPSERPAFVQGEIAEVPGKAVFFPGCIHLLVPSPVGHHLRRRVLSACVDLQAYEAEPRALKLGTASVGAHATEVGES
jgi:hypothetical protein